MKNIVFPNGNQFNLAYFLLLFKGFVTGCVGWLVGFHGKKIPPNYSTVTIVIITGTVLELDSGIHGTVQIR